MYHGKKAQSKVRLIYLMVGIFLSQTLLTYSQKNNLITMGVKAKIYSRILDKEIELSIHIPDSNAGSHERYPVLYTFQTHFEQISGAVKNLYDSRLIPKTMVVRIDNYEFGYLTPTKIERDSNSGKADVFLRFFKEELFPYIDSKYRTHPYRIVFSNSWGALFATYAILSNPEIFNAAIASILWITYDGDDRYMIKNLESFLADNKYHNFLYITMDNEAVILNDLETFLNILKKFPQAGLDWEYHYWPEEDHWSTPYRSVYSGLRSLFIGWNQIPIDIIYKGLDHIKKHEVSLAKTFGYDIGVSTSALRVAGSELQRDNKHDQAIPIYKYVIEKNPDDAFAYVTLGRAYEESGQFLLAKEAYEKGYDLAVSTNHPQMRWIKNFLDRITEKIK